MNTPTFELDRSSAAFIATLEVDSPMMQAPERRWLWSCLRRRRAHWRFGVKRESLPVTSAFLSTNPKCVNQRHTFRLGISALESIDYPLGRSIQAASDEHRFFFWELPDHQYAILAHISGTSTLN